MSNIFGGSATEFWMSTSRQDPILVERRRTMRPLQVGVTKRAFQLGVPLVGATDLDYVQRYDSGRVTVADNAIGFAEAGIPEMAAIKAITSRAAKLLGIDNRTGAIRKGFEADIVVIGGNPLLSIEALKDIRVIVNDGTVVLNK